MPKAKMSALFPLLHGRSAATFEIEVPPALLEEYQGKEIEITIKKARKRRTLDQNALLWACLGDIGAALSRDSWEVYMDMLERYGRFTYLEIRAEALAAFREKWRELRIVGERITDDGVVYQVQAFFGSSTYTKEEFRQLLDGVISEMKEMGLSIPLDERTERMLYDSAG